MGHGTWESKVAQGISIILKNSKNSGKCSCVDYLARQADLRRESDSPEHLKLVSLLVRPASPPKY